MRDDNEYSIRSAVIAIGRATAGTIMGAGFGYLLFWISVILWLPWMNRHSSMASDTMGFFLFILMVLSGAVIGGLLMPFRVESIWKGIVAGGVIGTVVGYPLSWLGSVFWPAFGTGSGVLMGAFVTYVVRASQLPPRTSG